MMTLTRFRRVPGGLTGAEEEPFVRHVTFTPLL